MTGHSFNITSVALKYARQMNVSDAELREMARARAGGGTGPRACNGQGNYFGVNDVMAYAQQRLFKTMSSMKFDPNKAWIPARRAAGGASKAGGPPELRDYQKQAMASLGNATDGFVSGGIDMECGLGKTFLAACIVWCGNGPALITCNSCLSVDQTAETIRNMNLPTVVVIKDGQPQGWRVGQPLPDVTLCTYALLSEHVHKFCAKSMVCRPGADHDPMTVLVSMLMCGEQLVTHVCDEYHVLPAQRWGNVCKIPAKWRVGLSGSLVREDNRIDELHRLVGPVRMVCQRPTDTCTSIQYNVVHIPSWNRAYDNAFSIVRAVNPFKLQYLCDDIRARSSGERCIVYCDVLDAIHMLTDELRERVAEDAITVIGPLTGKTPQDKREDAVREMRKSAQSCVLVTSRVLDTSVDIANIGTIYQVALVDGSRQQEEQRIGRGRRQMESNVRIVTMVIDNTREYDFAHHRLAYIRDRYNIDHDHVNDAHLVDGTFIRDALKALKFHRCVQQAIRTAKEGAQSLSPDLVSMSVDELEQREEIDEEREYATHSSASDALADSVHLTKRVKVA